MASMDILKSSGNFDLSELRGHADWKWYGFPGHLIVADRCAYHLCTKVGGYLISTVGAFYPDPRRSKKIETIGSGPDDFYETFVFKCSGERDGNPQIGFSEIDGWRYPDSLLAEKGHYEFCWKYHNAS